MKDGWLVLKSCGGLLIKDTSLKITKALVLTDKTISKQILFWTFLLMHELAAIFMLFFSIYLLCLDELLLQNFASLHNIREIFVFKVLVFLYFIFHFIFLFILKQMALNCITKYFPALVNWASVIAVALSFFSMEPGSGAIFDLSFYELIFYMTQLCLLNYSVLYLVTDNGTLMLNISPSTMKKFLGLTLLFSSIFFSYIFWG